MGLLLGFNVGSFVGITNGCAELDGEGVGVLEGSGLAFTLGCVVWSGMRVGLLDGEFVTNISSSLVCAALALQAKARKRVRMCSFWIFITKSAVKQSLFSINNKN